MEKRHPAGTRDGSNGQSDMETEGEVAEERHLPGIMYAQTPPQPFSKLFLPSWHPPCLAAKVQTQDLSRSDRLVKSCDNNDQYGHKGATRIRWREVHTLASSR